MINITNVDVLEWAEKYTGEKFHALISDPPYHLTSITNRFGKSNSAPAKYGSDGAFQRASSGFLHQTWDGGDIAFRPETWAALTEHLYPGAFGMAYASSRGWHRLACAIEDAGMIIVPSIFGWHNRILDRRNLFALALLQTNQPDRNILMLYQHHLHILYFYDC